VNRIVVLFNVGDDIICQCPLKEIELSNGRINIVKLDALPTTERIKHPFAVCLQVGLVCEIYDNMFLLLGDIGDVVLL
jgi:hypothetical protein